MVRRRACSSPCFRLVLSLMMAFTGRVALDVSFVARWTSRGVSSKLLLQRAAAPLAKDHSLDDGPLRQRHFGPAELGDMLIPPQPIGRLVQKGEEVAVEYDPSIDPEFVQDDYGYGGEFVWEPLTPEGGLISQDGYDELSFPVPVDRLEYIQGAGYLEAEEGEDYRAYLSETPEVRDGREFVTVVLKGGADSVRSGAERLMAGMLHRRPWDQAAAALDS
mmetsp:Transcript_66615/g.124323  ORF Transcript_66615/g.124323 Transcript_66615/m.124323 type:complete len:219 (-) Transcript_66615:22-678(-)